MEGSGIMTLGMKKNGSGWYLFKAIVGVLFSFLFFYLAIPKLVLMFVDYPTLEKATIIEGTLHIEQSPYRYGGRRSRGGTPDPTNYVIDSRGVSHKIFKGIRGDEDERFSSKDFEGLKVKVWFHPWYGIIQGEYEKTPEISAKFAKMFPPEKWGKRVDNPENVQIFKDKFSDPYQECKSETEYIVKYHADQNFWGFLIFVTVFIYTIYCFRKFFEARIGRISVA
jgi:hypothetical protein